MGNQPMTIGLRVNKPPKGEQDFKAGSIIYGRVYLSVSKKPQQASSVMLRLVGRETLVVHHTSQGEQTEHHNGRTHRSTVSHDHYNHSTHDIFQMEYALRTFPEGKIPKGQYEFPFALQLPDTLPSTMTCRRGQSSCEVKFELVAEVFQKTNSVFHTNLDAKEELRIASSTSISHQHDTSLHLPVDVIPVVRCWCSRKGTLALETKFDATTVGVNDGIRVAFRCQNRSTINVHTIRVRLVEVVEWTSQGQKEEVKTTLGEINLDAEQYPELERLRHKPRITDYFGSTGSHSLLEHQPWHTIAPIVIPRKAKDTYDGRGIQVRHSLSLELLTKGCCSSNPDATTLIHVYRSLASPTTESPAAAASPFALFDDQDDVNGSNNNTPSAPFEEDDPLATPSTTAPSDVYDEYYDDHPLHHHYQHPVETSAYVAVSTAAYDEATTSAANVTIVEAQMLPPDWNAQTAEIVTIPMAEAIVLGVESTSSTVPARRK